MLSWLRLVRFPNTLTAAADILAGVALGTATTDMEVPLIHVLCATGASMSLYAFGMALNDLVDSGRDSELHPTRPLPSGALSATAVRFFCPALLVFALCLLQRLPGWTTFSIGLALACFICVYDAALKRQSRLSPAAMGACRALNMGLGVAVAGSFAHGVELNAPLLVPIFYGILVAILTTISQFEEAPPTKAVGNLATALLWVSYLAAAIPAAHRMVTFWASVALGAWVTQLSARNAHNWGGLVRRGVFTLVFFDAIVALGSGSLFHAAICAGFYPVIRLLAWAIGQDES